MVTVKFGRLRKTLLEKGLYFVREPCIFLASANSALHV